MKDKIIKFYQDHEDKISVVSTVAGFAAAAAGVYLLVTERGHRVSGVFSGPDVAPGSTVFVTLKNGYVMPYTKPEA